MCILALNCLNLFQVLLAGYSRIWYCNVCTWQQQGVCVRVTKKETSSTAKKEEFCVRFKGAKGQLTRLPLVFHFK